MRKFFGGAAAFLALALLFFFVLPARAGEKSYKVMIPVLDSLKLNFLPQFFEGIKPVFKEKTGIELEIQQLTYTYHDEPIPMILDKMNKGEVDFALVYPAEYHYYLLEKKSNAVPLFAIEMFGKKYANLCLYTRKSDKISGIKQLKGKTWGGIRTRNARYLLQKAGIDSPVVQFFGKLKCMEESDAAAALQALLDSEIDVLTLPEPQVNFVLNSNATFKKQVNVSGCEKYLHSWLIVGREELLGSVSDTVKNTLLNFHEDPDFVGYRHILKMIQGRFVEVNLLDVYETIKYAANYKKLGWMDEERKFIKNNYKKENPAPKATKK